MKAFIKWEGFLCHALQSMTISRQNTKIITTDTMTCLVTASSVAGMKSCIVLSVCSFSATLKPSLSLGEGEGDDRQVSFLGNVAEQCSNNQQEFIWVRTQWATLGQLTFRQSSNQNTCEMIMWLITKQHCSNTGWPVCVSVCVCHPL